jgi:hypothetical protein
MSQKFFTNIVKVHADRGQVRRILQNPKHLLEWVSEIDSVVQDEQKFIITRKEHTFNHHETITVELKTNSIIYLSTEGKFKYRIIFTVNSEDDHSIIQEDVYLTQEDNAFLPLKLLKPIAKHAFNTNLNNLALLIEKIDNFKG